jgi:16S rRNA (cytosine967-C5)-methyltransferase
VSPARPALPAGSRRAAKPPAGRAPAGPERGSERVARAGRESGSGTVTARVLALDALMRIEEGAYSHVVLPAMLGQTNLSDRDRAFATDLVYGSVRAQRRIDDLLGHVVKRPLPRLDPPVRAALRIGAYQLLRDVPAHAAVGETVDAVAARSPRARGFVNANLRALTRLPRPWPEPREAAVALSYPDWLVARLSADLGVDDARDALAAMNEPAVVTLRPDPRRVTPGTLVDELRAAGADAEVGRLVADAVLVRGVGDPGRLPAVSEGRATPQDQGSQAVVAVLAPKAGESIADLAAAPGGKATAAAERVGTDGLVVALDVDAGRVRMVDGARHRIGLAWLAPVVGDGRTPPLRAGSFDRVLVDAPCSGLGVLRRRPDARWRLQPDTIDELAALQRELLAAAAPLVRPGGLLVYSVCTLTTAETVGVDEWAAEALPGFTPEAAADGTNSTASGAVSGAVSGAGWRRHGRGALLLPQFAGTDGMFVLALRAPS